MEGPRTSLVEVVADVVVVADGRACRCAWCAAAGARRGPPRGAVRAAGEARPSARARARAARTSGSRRASAEAPGVLARGPRPGRTGDRGRRRGPPRCRGRRRPRPGRGPVRRVSTAVGAGRGGCGRRGRGRRAARPREPSQARIRIGSGAPSNCSAKRWSRDAASGMTHTSVTTSPGMSNTHENTNRPGSQSPGTITTGQRVNGSAQIAFPTRPPARLRPVSSAGPGIQPARLLHLISAGPGVSSPSGV